MGQMDWQECGRGINTFETLWLGFVQPGLLLKLCIRQA